MNDAPSKPAPWWHADTRLRCPARRSDLVAQPLDDEVLLIDPRTQASFRLNRTAWDLWQRLAPDRSMRDVAGDVALAYAIDPEQALEDVEQTLAFFAFHSLIEDEPEVMA